MRLFGCQNCGQVLFFENQQCGRCGKRLGYLPTRSELSVLEANGSTWEAFAEPGLQLKFCVNASYLVCNWMLPASSPEQFCVACRHNRMVPDLSAGSNLQSWAKMEMAKHRLFYALLQLGLPTPNRRDDPKAGLVFDFLTDSEGSDGGKVMTGHEDGLITLAVAEADDAEREARRARMGEPYRTLLGHFRHEVGHFYWDILIRDGGRLADFRAVFGDERDDYGNALRRHYADGAPADWQSHFVSAYAGSHSWEDWAETWAHYLHIVDGLETARAFGLEIHPTIDPDHALGTGPGVDPYEIEHFEVLVRRWLPLTIALNAMNQSMGLNDLYPFVLSPAVITKLAFIHKVVCEGA
jgi:hypothetical protein